MRKRSFPARSLQDTPTPRATSPFRRDSSKLSPSPGLNSFLPGQNQTNLDQPTLSSPSANDYVGQTYPYYYRWLQQWKHLQWIALNENKRSKSNEASWIECYRTWCSLVLLRKFWNPSIGCDPLTRNGAYGQYTLTSLDLMESDSLRSLPALKDRSESEVSTSSNISKKSNPAVQTVEIGLRKLLVAVVEYHVGHEVIAEPQLQSAVARMIQSLRADQADQLQRQYHQNWNLIHRLQTTLALATQCLERVQEVSRLHAQHHQLMAQASQYYTRVRQVAEQKLQLVCAQTVEAMYQPPFSQLADAVARALHAEQHRVRQKIELVQQELRRYQALGQEFHRLAAHLVRTQREIKHVQVEIQRLKA